MSEKGGGKLGWLEFRKIDILLCAIRKDRL